MSSRLLGIAADVLRSFGSAFGGRHLAIVVGGVPSLLAPETPTGMAPHVGTADLDLHLSLHLLDGETADYYQAIIDGLRDLGLSPAIENGRQIKWRWVGQYRGRLLRVELLCPLRSNPGRPEKPATATPAEANIGPSDQLRRLVDDQFKDTDSAGSIMYADFLECEPGDLERRHAQGTLAVLGHELKRYGIELTR